MAVTIRHGDCREVLRTLPDGSVHCCVTSPPYFGLRDYGVAGQIGLETTPEAFVAELVDVFQEVRRALREDGTLWLNLGDSYAGSWGARGRGAETNAARPDLEAKHGTDAPARNGFADAGIKPKDLIGVPWRVAFALQADGWYLRQDIIWSKPNPMPESVTDRCTKAHEYIFLLSKSARYYYDQDAILEPLAAASVSRLAQDLASQVGSDRVPGKTNGAMKAVGRDSWKGSEFHTGKTAIHQLGRSQKQRIPGPETKLSGTYSEGSGRKDGGGHRSGGFVHAEFRNKRSVWEVPTQPFKEAHFATFPPELIEPCIKAGCPAGGIVLDPFGGAGTTGMVADRLQRDAILIELNPEYAAMAERRIRGDAGMFGAINTHG